MPIANYENKNKMKRKTALSTLWLFAVINYLYCDVIALMDLKMLKQFLSGNAGGFNVTEGFLFGASILMEIPIAMILLSRALRPKVSRLANIIAGTIMTVVQTASLIFGTSPTMYYTFFSIIEIGCTLFIILLAARWRNPETNAEV